MFNVKCLCIVVPLSQPNSRVPLCAVHIPEIKKDMAYLY